MNDWTAGLGGGIESNDPFGMSRFSIRRYSVQQFLLIILANLLLVILTAAAVIQGDLMLVGLSATTLIVVTLLTALVFRVGLRTIAVEAWIRRLGMGDFEYRIEPRGNDEVSKACLALETLRMNCIKAMQLDLVTQLSEEIRVRNQELEQAMSELRESQDQIISQQKLAELGELSSGVAHEMRNPLQFIANFTGASKELAAELTGILEDAEALDLPQARVLVSDIADNLDRVENHSSRIKGILSSMMIYDRGTGGGFRPVNLNQLLAEQTNLGYQAIQAYEPGFDAEISFRLDPSVEEVIAVPEDLARVVVNLAMNACQAMAAKWQEQGGEYRPELSVVTEKSIEGIIVTVKDNGTGMSGETRSRMFNPFFTTWQTGRNTGLGLSLVWDIVREHGGTIAAESEPGEGTEIKLLIPEIPAARPENLDS